MIISTLAIIKIIIMTGTYPYYILYLPKPYFPVIRYTSIKQNFGLHEPRVDLVVELSISSPPLELNSAD